MGELRKVREGEPFAPSTKWQHGTIEAIEFARRHRTGAPPGLRDLWQAHIVPVKNDSGADRNRFDVLGIDGPIITPTANLNEFKNRPALKGVTPTSSHVGKFAILLEPAEAGKIGAACIAGVTVAKVDIARESLTHADLKAGDARALRNEPQRFCADPLEGIRNGRQVVRCPARRTLPGGSRAVRGVETRPGKSGVGCCRLALE